MLKEFIWDTFEKTGDVNLYMFYRELEEKSRGIQGTSAAVEEAAISDIFKDLVLQV